MLKTYLTIILIACFTSAAHAQSIQKPVVDLEAVEKIIEEGTDRSQVMEIASWLTDVYGPRLTNSPQMRRANNFVLDKLDEFGLENGTLHRWGPFGKGWELTKFAMHATTPYTYFPVSAFPKAWSSGHKKTVKGEVIHLTLESEEDFNKYKGKLKDKFVMIEFPPASEPSWDPIARRNSEERLLNLANAGEQIRNAPPQGPNPAALARAEMRYKLEKFLQDEQPLAVLDYSYRGWYGQIALSMANIPSKPGTPWLERPRPFDADAPDVVPQVSLAREHYGRIFRLLEKNIPVTIEMDLQVQFHDDDLFGYNTIAEIPGSDPDLKDEIVMLGAHLDSWHSATGATDNASGSAVMMEAVRILKAIGIEPRRTIRIALWDGEEQGLHGSRNYVSDHFAAAGGGFSDADNIVHKPEFDNFSAYYNIDNGTGQVRGIYLQQNETLRTLFRTWLQPFSDWDANTVSFSNTGGTDHLAFDRVGLPGFQFIQDPIEYGTMTHHSNQDFYERLVEQDLQRTAIIAATFVYHTAMLDEKLPRKTAAEENGSTVSN